MNAGPNGPPPDQAPPAPPEGHEPAAYYPPPAGGPPPAAAPRRGRGPLIAVVLVVVIVVVVIVGYGVAGYAFAQSKLNTAQASYNAVVDHQNSLTDTVNSLDTKVSATNVSGGTVAELQADRTAFAQVISQSQTAQAQIDTDDPSLVKADAGLKENQWLTVVSKPNLDKASTRIGHLRKALADAKVITADYVQIGTFYQSLVDVVIDIDAVGTAAQAKDIPGATTANNKLKADTDKAISLDKAAGLPAEMDAFLQAVKSLANDFGSLFTAVAAGNTSGINSAEKAIEADVAKVQAIDYTKIEGEIKAFYKPLLDDYNSEIDKANRT